MRIVFMGTADFSATVLEKLNEKHPVCAVITGLDKQMGRGQQVKFSPLKEKALSLGIPVMQYEKVSRDGIEDVSALNADVIITAAFGQILSERFLQIPKFGVLNVHASLLPKYRGSSPIQWAIINGEQKTGITIMRTVKAIDAGDVLLTKEIEIGRANAGEMFDSLAELGGDAINEAIDLLEEGNAVFTPQNHAEATHCSMISKADGRINFAKTSREIDCFVRGMTPWPSAFLMYDEKILKVFDVESVNYDGSEPCGTVVYADRRHGIVVKTLDGAVRLSTIQLQGSKRMTDADFLLGHSIPIGIEL